MVRKPICRHAAGVLALSLAVLLAGACGPTPGPSPSPEPTTTTTEPSPTPTGPELPKSDAPLGEGEIVWRHQTDGRWAITTVTTRGLAGDDLVAGSENVAAVLSPDRRTVLYLRKEGDGRSTLHAVSADGRNDLKLFSDGSTDCPRLRRPALGPDDTLALVCAGFDEGDEDTLTIMTLSGDVVDQLDRGQLGDPTFSPDGSTLVYARSTVEPYIYGGDLFSVAVNGSGSPRQLVRGSNLNPVWQPDGTDVAFVSRDDDDTLHLNLVQIPDDGSRASRPRRLSEIDEYDQDPSWSPDGTRIAFRRGRSEPHLFVFDDQGEGDREVVRDNGTASAPVWTAR